MNSTEKNNTVKNSKTYLYLVCLVTALGGFLFGFDTAVISGTISLVKGDFRLDAVSEGWFVSCALLGCMIGVSISGKLSDHYGRKIVMILSAFLFFKLKFWATFSGLIKRFVCLRFTAYISSPFGRHIHCHLITIVRL